MDLLHDAVEDARVAKALHQGSLSESREALLKPPRLRRGQTIALVSPAGWMRPDDIERAAATLTTLGFVPHVDPQNFLRNYHFAGRVKERADAIHAAFLDERVHAVMAVQGGYGSDHLLDLLDYELIRAHPKCFIGYSDVTSILHGLRTRAGIVSFHGPMLHSFVEHQDTFTLDTFVDVLTGRRRVSLELGATAGARVIREGSGRGELAGGNLTTLTRLIGTPYELDTRGRILFVEDVDEELYTLDRMFLHLKQAGKLHDLQALLVADFANVGQSRVTIGKTVDEIVLDACAGTTFPIVSRFPCGHGVSQATLPLGIPVTVIAEGRATSVTFDELAVA